MKKPLILIISILILILTSVLLFSKKQPSQESGMVHKYPPCKNKEYIVRTKISSGETGTVYISDSRCEYGDRFPENLEFKEAKGGISYKGSLGTDFYIWLRDEKFLVTEQIQNSYDSLEGSLSFCKVSEAKTYLEELYPDKEQQLVYYEMKNINDPQDDNQTYMNNAKCSYFKNDAVDGGHFYESNNVLIFTNTTSYIKSGSIRFVPDAK